MINLKRLNVSHEVLRCIAEIDEFKGTWQALKTLSPDRLRSLRRVATIESVGSSTRIEGSKLSDRDVEKLLSDLELKHFDTRDKQEVSGYGEVMELVFQSWQEIHLTENHIKQLHRDLLKYSEKDIRHRGEYKKLPNNVAAFDESGKQVGVVFETASPFDTSGMMGEIVEWMNAELAVKKLHPLLAIVVFVVVFLEIHPFQDGNGRLSRILTTLLLLRSGYEYVPYSSLESIVEKNKDGYYLALRQCQRTIRTEHPDWQPWVNYFLKILLQQCHNLAKKIEREKIILSRLPKLSLKILNHVREHGRTNLLEMLTLTGANRNTLKSHFKKLVVENYLTLRGKGRGSWYELP